jgi:hypothetical protein
MTRKLTLTAVFALLTSVSSAFAGERENNSILVETTSVGSIGGCQAEVSRSLKICDRAGKCKRSELGDETQFALPEGGSFVVTASVSYSRDGVIHGDAAVDRYDSVANGERLVQTLTTGEGCSQVFSYEFHVR